MKVPVKVEKMSFFLSDKCPLNTMKLAAVACHTYLGADGFSFTLTSLKYKVKSYNKQTAALAVGLGCCSFLRGTLV